ncbi:MAG: hypothetical protein ACE5I7_18120 [Candidatus Binatia bacterium]
MPIRHFLCRLVRFAGFADGVVELGPCLGFVLGFVQVADGAEAVGVAVPGVVLGAPIQLPRGCQLQYAMLHS